MKRKIKMMLVKNVYYNLQINYNYRNINKKAGTNVDIVYFKYTSVIISKYSLH